MSQIRTKKSAGYSAIILSGSEHAAAAAAAALRSAGYLIAEASPRSIVAQDVRDNQLPYMEEVATTYAMDVSAVGRNEYVDTERVQVRKAFKLSLQPKKWYYSDNLGQYPLIFIRDVQIQKVGDTEDEAQVVTMELHAVDGTMPLKHIAASNEVAQYGLRPALPDDFDNLGMIVPDAMYLSASVVASSTPDEDYLENVSIS